MAKQARKSKKAKNPGRLRQMLGKLGEKIGPIVVRALTIAVLISAGVVSLCVVGNEMRRQNLKSERNRPAAKWGIVLENTPAWMPPRLADIISANITPKNDYFSQDTLCEHVKILAGRCPWIEKIERIEKVKVGPKIGAVKVYAKYREPFARVRFARNYYFVDSKGIVLPESQVPQWEAVIDGYVYYFLYPESVPVGVTPMLRRFVLIDGVEAGPSQAGTLWHGGDLQAGLRLAKLVSTRNYSRQISMIDVRNFNERVTDSEPELRMYAQIGQSAPTDIRFGRFPRPEGGDWVKTPDEKMRFLDQYVEDHGGRLAGIHRSIDVRMDELRSSLN